MKSTARKKFRLKAAVPPPPRPPAFPGMLEAAAPESKGGRSLDPKM